MLTQTYRPKKFIEVYGAEQAKTLLRRIVQNPKNAPRSLLFKGERGCGKTTSVRIFAKALNCEKRKDGDCCNECDVCKSITDSSPLYSELDSAVVGSIDQMKTLRQQFAYGIQGGTRVISLDECHLVSKAAQGAMLKVLEEAPPTVFFVFLTTDPDRLLPTIHSRSLPVDFFPLTEAETVSLLKKISHKEGIDVEDSTLTHIYRRVQGHARDALQQLEMVRLLGNEGYRDYAKVLDQLFQDLIDAFASGQKSRAAEIISTIVSQPVGNIQTDFDIFISRISDDIAFKGDKDPKKKDLLLFYLRNHQFVSTTNDWYIFLSYFSSVFDMAAAKAGGGGGLTTDRFKIQLPKKA